MDEKKQENMKQKKDTKIVLKVRYVRKIKGDRFLISGDEKKTSTENLPGITDEFSQVRTSAMTWFPTSVTLWSPSNEKNIKLFSRF